jgi:hypothetical protein
MAIIDSQGRLFGKLSILDLGAGLVMLLVAGSIILSSTSGLAQLGEVKPVEFDVIARLGAKSATDILKVGDKTNLIIRGQKQGEGYFQSVTEQPRNATVPQPNGSVKALPDPRPEAAVSKDFQVTISGNARITEDGPVLGGSKLKIGTKVELEGPRYSLPDLTLLDVRVKN